MAPPLTIAAAAANFTRNIDAGLARIEAIVTDARERGAGLVVLPDATLGGYLSTFRVSDEHDDPPPALDPHGPELARVREVAGPTVVCLGYCEADGDARYNTAVCVSGDGVLGMHRKVHLPPPDQAVYLAGGSFAPFDTPVGRMGLLIDYDKTFPESARTLASRGAATIACLCAWPASVSVKATRLDLDPQSRLFDLYDRARAAENQVVWVAANQCGQFGQLRFLGQSKVVGPGGQVLATTGTKPGLAVATVDVDAELERARRTFDHLAERVPSAYLSTSDSAAEEPHA
jgi:predicted amidohydrolase